MKIRVLLFGREDDDGVSVSAINMVKVCSEANYFSFLTFSSKIAYQKKKVFVLGLWIGVCVRKWASPEYKQKNAEILIVRSRLID